MLPYTSCCIAEPGQGVVNNTTTDADADADADAHASQSQLNTLNFNECLAGLIDCWLFFINKKRIC